MFPALRVADFIKPPQVGKVCYRIITGYGRRQETVSLTSRPDGSTQITGFRCGSKNDVVEFDLVPGVMENDMQRRQYEDVFVRQISKDDVIGLAGYTVMPDREDYDNESEIRDVV